MVTGNYVFTRQHLYKQTRNKKADLRRLLFFNTPQASKQQELLELATHAVVGGH